MYIRQIHINKFRHLENVNLGPFRQPPDNSDLIALAGPNGGGKSSVLELIGFALSSAWSLGWALGRSFPSNSFEVAIAVTHDELTLIQEYSESARSGYADDVMKFIAENGIYYRAFNYQGGEYDKNTGLYNQIHNIVTTALRNHYSRSLGFFLKSDRFYPSRGFERNRLFSYSEIIERNYIWSMAFNTSELQYRDIFEFLVQQRYHYLRQLGAFHDKQNRAPTLGATPPSDPLKPYDELLQRLFPNYKFTDSNEDIPSNLFVQIPSGEIIPFSDLSSGEKEVFFILSFFLRHDVRNAVIVIDEPELHLHPELARLLVRTMQSIKPGNQIWLATHNAEIIDEVGRDSLIYFTRDAQTHKSVVRLGTDENESVQLLKDFFGYSGYIGIAKSMVFLEGRDSSSDRKVFSTLFPDYGSKIKLVPSRSSSELPRINRAILSILESSLSWLQFYLVRDRDYLTTEEINKYKAHSDGRMYFLERHEIENYLINPEVIAKVQTEIFGKTTTPHAVEQKLRSIARNIAGEVLRDMLSYRLNLAFYPEDFSLGKVLHGEVFLDQDSNWIPDKVDTLKQLIGERINTVNQLLLRRTNPDVLNEMFVRAQDEIKDATSSNGWVSLFPGKRLLEEYARQEELGKPPTFQNSLIKEFASTPERIPSELSKLIRVISEGGSFPT